MEEFLALVFGAQQGEGHVLFSEEQLHYLEQKFSLSRPNLGRSPALRRSKQPASPRSPLHGEREASAEGVDLLPPPRPASPRCLGGARSLPSRRDFHPAETLGGSCTRRSRDPPGARLEPQVPPPTPDLRDPGSAPWMRDPAGSLAAASEMQGASEPAAAAARGQAEEVVPRFYPPSSRALALGK